MIVEAIDRILDLQGPLHVSVKDNTYQVVRGNGDVHLKHLPPDQQPDPVEIRSLTALAGFCRRELNPEEEFVLVKGASCVEVLGSLGDDEQRGVYCRAVDFSGDASGGVIGQYMSPGKLVLALETFFDRDEETDREALLKVVGNIKSGVVKQLEDNGYAQHVTIKAGVEFVGDHPLPSPVLLAPFRTFSQIQSPISAFVVRARDGDEVPQVGIWPCDGGMWEAVAIERIVAFLQNELEGWTVLG